MKNKHANASLHIRVHGRVQGVGFRAFVVQNAKLFKLRGWVRNVGRDQVETHAEGTQDDLERFLKQVKTGPSVSYVKECEFEWGEFRGEFKNFKVRWF